MTTYYDAFISYGRKHSKEFAKTLTQRLEAKNLNIWFDQNDIPPAVDWQEQINDGITRANNVLFIISPHSVQSPYCRIEIELAVKLNKRILPLLHVDANEYYDLMHPIIQKTNWLWWLENSETFNFDTSFQELLETIRKHEDYVQQHTEYLVSALEWQDNQRQTQHLLVGSDRVEAEKWLGVRFKGIEQPPCIPTDLHCEYICESTKNANNLLTQVFIGATKKDEIYRDKLVKDLNRAGITSWTNKNDSNSGEELQNQINQGIEGTDNFIFLISADSVEDFWCKRELEHAIKYNKRIIPVLIEEINKKLIPSEINELEYINNLEDENLDELIRIILEDAIYYQKHKLLLVKAIKWHSQNRNRSLLLRGYNLQHFEAWFNIAIYRNSHPPIPIQSEFLKASKGQTTAEVLDVFISYSRADADFARSLNERLQELGKATWFDQESIAVGEDYKREIEKGIEASDNFVFIISPRSINSPYCADEVEHAFMLNKRFITILAERVNNQDLHPALARVQWIDFSDGNFWLHFYELVRVLDTDREHVRDHTKWSGRALEWLEKGKKGDLLLRGASLETAKDWLRNTETKKLQPGVTALQREYITKSRNQKIKNVGLLIGSVVGALAITTGLWLRSEHQTRIAQEHKAAETEVINNLGKIYNQLGYPQEAIAYYEISLARIRKLGDKVHEVKILNNLGEVYARLGETTKALEYFQQSLDISQEIGNKALENITLNNLGEVYSQLGELEKAIGYYQQSLERSKQLGDIYLERIPLNNIGEVYSQLGELEKAIAYYEQSLEKSREVGDQALASTTLNNIGEVYSQLGKPQKAIVYYEKSLELAVDRQNKSRIINNLGQVYYQLGENAEARDYFKIALYISREIGDKVGEGSILINLANLERSQGNLIEAKTYLETALNIIENVHKEIINLDIRASYFATTNYYELYIDLLIELDELNPNSGYDIEAFNASEKYRTRRLLELSEKSGAEIRTRLVPDLLAQEKAILAKIKVVETKKEKLYFSNQSKGGSRNKLKLIEDKLDEQLDKVQNQIRTTIPQSRYIDIKQAQPLTLEEIQANILDDKTVILHYYLSEEKRYVWVVSKDNFASYTLPQSEKLQKAFTKVLNTNLDYRLQFDPEIAKSENIEATKVLSELILPSDIVSFLANKKRIIIVPDGVLNYIPFNMLFVPNTQELLLNQYDIIHNHFSITIEVK